MKLVTRRILFCICLILFLTISPLVILYAFGFRYNFAQRKLVQTGIIYLTPNSQDGIKILIDNKEETNRINTNGIFKKDFILYNLIPKTYNIRVSKENYHTWEKNLVVLPGVITYAKPLLLPSNPKINLLFSKDNVSLWSISDKFKRIFYLMNEGGKISANIYNFSNITPNAESAEALSAELKNVNFIAENSSISFAPDGKKFSFILPQENTKIILLNSTENNISPIADFTSKDKILQEQWDDSSRYFLYLNEKGELNSFDAIAKKPKKMLENVLGFYSKGEDIYFLNQNNLFFYRSSINDPLKKQQLSYASLDISQRDEKKEKIIQSNIIDKTKIIISAKNTIAAITPEKNLFIIDYGGLPAKLGNNIEAGVFSKNGDNLVFNSSFEIFTYDLGNGQENLITRLSQKISNVNWYSDYNHLWFLTNETIKNIELDSRPTPNIIDFVNMPKKPADIVYADMNKIYYSQKDNNVLSIYMVEIQK